MDAPLEHRGGGRGRDGGAFGTLSRSVQVADPLGLQKALEGLGWNLGWAPAAGAPPPRGASEVVQLVLPEAAGPAGCTPQPPRPHRPHDPPPGGSFLSFLFGRFKDTEDISPSCETQPRRASCAAAAASCPHRSR